MYTLSFLQSEEYPCAGPFIEAHKLDNYVWWLAAIITRGIILEFDFGLEGQKLHQEQHGDYGRTPGNHLYYLLKKYELVNITKICDAVSDFVVLLKDGRFPFQGSEQIYNRREFYTHAKEVMGALAKVKDISDRTRFITEKNLEPFRLQFQALNQAAKEFEQSFVRYEVGYEKWAKVYSKNLDKFNEGAQKRRHASRTSSLSSRVLANKEPIKKRSSSALPSQVPLASPARSPSQHQASSGKSQPSPRVIRQTAATSSAKRPRPATSKSPTQSRSQSPEPKRRKPTR
ncbi:MAG: hypothetical protein CYPHOPRED_005478 [Cyphobasidiales sp. Tagirdzhanova-0007]|nr:MAG: hypothetical protein CYPHOPRED_005478 [Cyphobasidiales sp. Tagirdzhanova-0007]